jgi:starch-binding outer membrane protein, SusD/RagB family
LAAYHLLSEVYIALGQWQDAVDAASVVIDHPNTALMTERFGTRVNGTRANGGEIPERVSWARGGDVYWDLFRQGNINRSTGNTEAIWVIQYGYNMPGGGGEGQFLGGPGFERRFNSRLWIANLYNDDGSFVNITPQANTYYGGRTAGQNRLSHYFFNVIWEKSGWDEDIRNSEWNMIRDLKVNNPASDYDGKWIFADNVPIQLNRSVDTLRNVYPALVAKISNLGDHPEDIWMEDQTVPGTITMLGGPSNTTHRNFYEIRLAETYLLRAEAYLGLGNESAAAEDVNTVRRRSSAPEVAPSEVDIDYILEERARELYLEEKRLLTLTRLGKLVEIARKHNPDRGNTLNDHNNLFPIPFSEIEKNLEVKMEQNPGY